MIASQGAKNLHKFFLVSEEFLKKSLSLREIFENLLLIYYDYPDMDEHYVDPKVKVITVALTLK